MNEELKVIISAEVSKLRQGVENAKQAIKGFGEQVEKAKKDVDSKFKAIGESINNAANKIKIGIAAAGAALLATAASTEEYRNQQAQLKTAFEAAGASAKQATTTYNGLYRVLGDTGQAQEAAQHLAKLTTEEKALNEWNTILQGTFATYGASLPLEGLTEAVNHSAKLGSVQSSLADALEWSGISVDAFNAQLAACNSESEREKLIRETLLGLYGEAAATYEKNNAEVLAQRDAQAKLQEKLADVGKAIAPVITAFTNLASDALGLVSPYIEKLAETLIPKLKTVLENVIEAIKTAAQWIKEHETLLQAIAVAVGIVVSAITMYNTVAAVKAAMAAAEVVSIGGLIAAYAAQAVAMAAALAPYLLIAAAIAALIAVIVLCVKHWDEIKEAAAKAWQGIKDAWAKAGEWFVNIVISIKEAFDNIGEWFKEKFTKARDNVNKAFENVGDWFSDKFTKAKKGVENAWSSTKQFFTNSNKSIQDAFAKVDSYMSNKFGSAWDGVKQAFAPFVGYFKQCWETVKGIFSVVQDVLTGDFRGAWEGIKGIFSGWANFFGGLWQTIKDIFSRVGSSIGEGIKGAVSSAVNAVLRTAANIINGFISAINFAIDIINAIPGVNIKRLDKLNVPQMAKGGVVDSATLAVIGERGKEAVMPLENNLEWLDKLAGMLNERMGGNQPIVLKVGEKVFGEIAVDSINNLTRQRGSIPLVIA